MKKQFKYVALAAVLAAASLAPAFGSEAKVSGKWGRRRLSDHRSVLRWLQVCQER